MGSAFLIVVVSLVGSRFGMKSPWNHPALGEMGIASEEDYLGNITLAMRMKVAAALSATDAPEEAPEDAPEAAPEEAEEPKEEPKEGPAAKKGKCLEGSWGQGIGQTWCVCPSEASLALGTLVESVHSIITLDLFWLTCMRMFPS